MLNSAIFKDKILREPLFPLDNLLRIPEEKKSFDAFVDSLYDNIRFRDAIFLSSPELFAEWEKVRQGKERGTVSLSIMKFFLRSISNTVPFGLFAAYSVNNDAGGKDGEFTRFSDVDSDYLIKLIARLNEHPVVRKFVRYRNNNTIYQVGEKYRYIEPSVVNRKLNYTLISIEYNEVLRLLLDVNRKELLFDELVSIVVDNVEDVDSGTAAAFIDELIRSKVFLSSLDLALNEGDLLEQLIGILEEGGDAVHADEYLHTVIEALVEVRDRLIGLDQRVFNDQEVYTAIFSALERIGIEFDKKLIVCSNLRRNGARFEDLEGKVQKMLGVLERVSPPPSPNDNLTKFRERFYRRYEDAEAPLLEVLDNELGIGYLPDLEEHFVFSDLTDSIELPAKKLTQQKITISPEIYQFWQNCLLTGEKVIDLEKKDLGCFRTESTSVGTFSVMFSYANNKISLKNAGNSSATMLLGRFSSRDGSVREMLNGIADMEAGYFKNEVLAEIVHLPNNRTANVTIRNIRREAEISILSKNSAHAENVLLEDLVVSVKGDKIVVRSRTTGKEVIPFLTSAQNYSFDSLPVYQFLCDLQSQSRKNYFTLNFGGLRLGMLDFFPRVMYGEDIILRKASWRLRKSEVLKMPGVARGAEKGNGNGVEKGKADKITAEQLLAYVEKAGLPKYIYFTEGNEDKMIIDTSNRILLEILVQEINKKDYVDTVECIYDITEEQTYANEYIYSCYSKNEIPAGYAGAANGKEVRRRFVL
ncbi:MAG: lantibiotic dehydratase family protein, partial [Bacteroidetes bacterium]|nr:lantibiotic dehydratase family protein [Bacteroidota bacterium]